MHPPQGDAEIRILPLDHTVTRGLDDFVLFDERYSYLRVSPEVEVLATHVHDELEHPVVWAYQLPARASSTTGWATTRSRSIPRTTVTSS